MTNLEIHQFAKNKSNENITKNEILRELRPLIEDTNKEINLTEGIEIIRANFFMDSSVEKITLPSSLREIWQYAFSKCKFQYIEIPENVALLKNGVFQNCTNLKQVDFMQSDRKVEFKQYVFQGCTNLSTLRLPPYIDMPSSNLSGCINLEFVILSDGFNSNGLNLSASTKYSADTIVAMLNALADRTGLPAYTLTLGNTNLAKLNDEQLAIAISKNWTLA